MALATLAGGLVTIVGGNPPAMAQPVAPVEPTRIQLTVEDMEFILAQIQIAEAHPEGTGTLCTAPDALTNPLACQNAIINTTLPFGIRQTNGQNNNLVPGQEQWGSADRRFPRLTSPHYLQGDDLTFDPDGPGGAAVGDPTSYTQNAGIVEDKDPRIISNLIADQTEQNPAATAAAAETIGHGFTSSTILVDHDRNPNTPKIVQYVLPNVAPDAGFSASYNSLFTLFGQFFDHGLDLAAKGGSGSVFVPLQEDDPLYIPGSSTNFMVLTRATNQPGPDGVLGTEDDIKDATNLVTPYIDNNQTYTSNPSHQVFLREYRMNDLGQPVPTGRLLTGVDGGLPTWDDVKRQAHDLLGIQLSDTDIFNVPLVATDAYGRFLPGPTHGLPSLVLADGITHEGNLASPASPTALGALRIGHAFLDDIAHHAVPGTWDDDHDPTTPKVPQLPDSDPGTADDQLPGTYDDEMLGAHFICGDGRCNENIGLTAMHEIFHDEHNGLVQQIEQFVTTIPSGSPAALPAWRTPDGQWNGERIFQAAKFVNEMEYQHIVFGEFARAIQPNVNLFDAYSPNSDPAITAEFAHAVYRFGHSMLTETVARTEKDGSHHDIPLMDAFLNPVAFNDGGSAGHLTAQEAAGSIVRGMVNQRGEEIDEFVTEALRNNLVGLPLDLPTLNITRARSEGIAPLNQVRRELFNGTIPGAGGNTNLQPYTDWVDFGMALRHQASLVNFVAAYGTHPSITAETTVAGKRAAAQLIVDDAFGAPADAADFMNGTGAWANVNGRSVTGLEDVDLWIGGLAESPGLFGGMLGSTFNFVFERQMEALQDNDRLYYLARTAGLPLLAELEGNTFSDLVRRNTDALNVPVMAFTRSDWTLDMNAQTNSTGIVDDPATPYDERNLDGAGSKLLRGSDGTIRLTGKGLTENHTTWMGTNGNDKIRSAEGDDSIWGNDGNDRLEGGIGADMIEGGYGDDILTDLSGDDVIAGGDGNDVIQGGNGLDVMVGDTGKDAVFHGIDDAESFGGQGNDFMVGNVGVDDMAGGPGEDWVEGGDNGDLLTGDDRAPFAVITGEDDVLIGGKGDDRYLSEGGMDIAMAGEGIDTTTGGLGFDFVSYARAAVGAFADLRLAPVIAGGLANPRDRFQTVESIAGSPFDDSIRGDDKFRPQGHELLQASMDKVEGLADLLAQGHVLAPTGTLNMFVGDDLLMGGGGSDSLEGGGGNDFIDGDASLDVDLHCTAKDGTPFTLRSLNEVQAMMIAGQMSPGDCQMHRFITHDSTGVDTAVYRFPMSEYFIGFLPDGRVTVTHLPVKGGGGGGGGGGGNNEGSDVLLNVEFLQFLDTTIPVEIPGSANNPPQGSIELTNQFPVVGGTVDAVNAVFDLDGIDPATETYTWQTWDGVTTDVFGDPVWVNVQSGNSQTYTVLPTDLGAQIRVLYTYTDLAGNPESVISLPTDPVTQGVVVLPSGVITLEVPPFITSPAVTVLATFVDGNGLLIAGADITLDVNGTTFVATTDVNGVATFNLVLDAPVDSLLLISASGVDPAPLDPANANVFSNTWFALAEYAAITVTSAATVTEGADGAVTPLTATITLDRPAPVDVTFDWSVTGGTATDGADFTNAGGTVTIPTGSQTVDVSLDVLGDSLVEGDETVDVTIGNIVGALPTGTLTQTGTIVDDDLPTLSLGADPTVTESDGVGGPGVVQFDLVLDQPAAAPVAVNWSLVAGTAMPGTDYLDDAGLATFAAGDQTVSVFVTLVDDTEVELPESFAFQVDAVTGANGPAVATATATVLDDDQPIVTAGPDLSVAEGANGARNTLNYTVVLDRPSVYDLVVTWTATGGTARGGTDYTPTAGTVTVPAGSTSVTVPVTILGDNTIEPNETVPFTITSATNAIIGARNQAMGTILDDDTPPSLRINDVTITEGNAGFKMATFTVTLSRPSSSPVSVTARTHNGTAVGGGDFARVSTTVRFAAGQTTATVTVPIAGDRLKERNETYTVQLSSATGATIADGSGLGIIVNDD